MLVIYQNKSRICLRKRFSDWKIKTYREKLIRRNNNADFYSAMNYSNNSNIENSLIDHEKYSNLDIKKIKLDFNLRPRNPKDMRIDNLTKPIQFKDHFDKPFTKRNNNSDTYNKNLFMPQKNKLNEIKNETSIKHYRDNKETSYSIYKNWNKNIIYSAKNQQKDSGFDKSDSFDNSESFVMHRVNRVNDNNHVEKDLITKYNSISSNSNIIDSNSNLFKSKKSIISETTNNRSDKYFNKSANDYSGLDALTYRNLDYKNLKKSKRLQEKLYQDKKTKQKKCHSLVKEQTIDKKQEYTFIPNKVETQDLRKLKKCNSVIMNGSNIETPVYEKLYKERNENEKRIKALSLKKEKLLKAIYTFSPKNFNTSKQEKLIKDKSDFFERAKSFELKKAQNLKEIKKRIELERATTSSQNNKHKNKSFSIKEKGKAVLNITAKINEHRGRKSKNIKRIMNKVNQDHGITFKPKLNISYNQKIYSTMLERSLGFIENKKQKLLRVIDPKEELECTFSPRINSPASPIRSSDEDPNVSQRLYNYRQIYKRKLNLKKEQYKENHPFKPKISKNTNKILEQKQKLLRELKKQIENIEKSKLESLLADKASNLEYIGETGGTLNNENDSVVQNNFKGKKRETPVNGQTNNPTSPISHHCNEDDNQSFSIPEFEPISDSKLYEMASIYITTDESLENFQQRNKLKTKGDKVDSLNKDFNFEVQNNDDHCDKNQARFCTSIYSDYDENNFQPEEKERNLSFNISKESFKKISNHNNTNYNAFKRKDRLVKNFANDLKYYAQFCEE